MNIFKNSWIENLNESSHKTLTVSFKTNEMIFERIYERDLKLKFKRNFSSITRIKPSVSGVRAAFDVIFKGEKNELKKIADYITGTLDKKNDIYDSHQIK